MYLEKGFKNEIVKKSQLEYINIFLLKVQVKYDLNGIISKGDK